MPQDKHSVGWLGSLPSRWEARGLKHISRFAYGDTLIAEDRQPGDVAVFGSNGVVGKHTLANTKGPCVVIGRKGSFGKVNFSPEPVFAIDTTYFVDERFSSANIRWLFYVLGWLRLDQTTKDAAVPGLSREDAYKETAPYPPLPEQAAIAHFLDHMDHRIQKYIRAKEKLIALLDEYKQALIHQAVTGQIDVRTGEPYPEYKESGVEWLGMAPKHWNVVPLKRVLTNLVDCEHKTAPMVDASDYYVIRTSAVRNGSLNWDGAYCTDPNSFDLWTRRCVPRYGDVIFTREAPAGEACLVPRGRQVCLGQRTVLLRTDDERCVPSFLVHMIYQGPPKFRIELASQGSTVDHFNV